MPDTPRWIRRLRGLRTPRGSGSTGPILVVHSGTFKTGSTSIQLFLAGRASELEATGATYPDAGRSGGRLQHENLLAELKGWRSFTASDGTWLDVFALFDRFHTVVVSSESFSRLTVEEARRIGAAADVRGVRVVWVHYVRGQASLLNAFYVERLMNLRPEFAELVTRPIDSFMEWSPIELDFMDYATFLDSVATAIPDVDLRVRPFLRSELADGDVVSDFVRVVGLDIEPVPTRTNVGAGWKTVETARFLTPLLKHAPLSERADGATNPAAARLPVLSLIRRRLIEASERLGWNDESAVYVSDAFAERITERFRLGNDALCERYGVDLSGATVKDFNAGTLEEIPTSELTAVLAEVMPSVIDPPRPDET